MARTRASPERARRWLSQLARPLPSETVDIDAAVGRVLGAPCSASRDWPPTDRASLDGYAVNTAAVAGASDYNPLPLQLVKEQLLTGQKAAAIFAGDTLPAGADAVLPQEDVLLRNTGIEVCSSIAVGTNVIRHGEEMRQGEVVLEAGRRLRPEDIAMLRALGVESVVVIRRPRVRIFLASQPTPPVDLIAPMLHALVTRDGGEVEAATVTDSETALGNALAELDSDLALICGGSGDGTNDRAAPALARYGHMELHGLAMNPGETAGIGCIGELPVVLIPGNPLAGVLVYEWLVGGAVRVMAGRSDGWEYGTCRVPLSHKIASTLGRLEFCRVRVHGNQATPLATVEGRLLSTVVRADGLVIVPPESEGWPAGTEVTVWLRDGC